MKRKVHWSEEVTDRSDFSVIKEALKSGDIARVTEMLRALSPESLSYVLHQEDGYLITKVIKRACENEDLNL